MLRLVARWLPTRSLVVVADQAFSALAFLDAVRQQVTVITRLRLDAARTQIKRPFARRRTAPGETRIGTIGTNAQRMPCSR